VRGRPHCQIRLVTQSERQRNVLGDGERRDQSDELMDHSNRERTQRLTGADARPGNRSTRALVEPGDQIEQRRLPAARGAQERNVFAEPNRKRRWLETDDHGNAVPKLACKAFSLDNRRCHRRSVHPEGE
jgi:hypothetical protein